MNGPTTYTKAVSQMRKTANKLDGMQDWINKREIGLSEDVYNSDLYDLHGPPKIHTTKDGKKPTRNPDMFLSKEDGFNAVHDESAKMVHAYTNEDGQSQMNITLTPLEPSRRSSVVQDKDHKDTDEVSSPPSLEKSASKKSKNRYNNLPPPINQELRQSLDKMQSPPRKSYNNA